MDPPRFVRPDIDALFGTDIVRVAMPNLLSFIPWREILTIAPDDFQFRSGTFLPKHAFDLALKLNDQNRLAEALFVRQISSSPNAISSAEKFEENGLTVLKVRRKK